MIKESTNIAICGERWLPVRGYEGLYEVSSLGRARRVHRPRGMSPTNNDNDGRVRRTGNLMLAPLNATGGHLAFRMVNRDGKAKNLLAHRLVALAFIGPPPTEREFLVRHVNGVPDDNRVENLAWGGHLENQGDRKAHNTRNTGERNSSARLTESEVWSIRERRAKGETVINLGREFGVSNAMISVICLGNAWTHVGGPIQASYSVHGRRKLTPPDHDDIFRMRSEGMPIKEVARRFGISWSIVSKIYLERVGREHSRKRPGGAPKEC